MPRLIDLINDAPIIHDQQRADEGVACFADLPAPACNLLAGTIGCSPYLADLIRLDPQFCRSCFETPPEAMLDKIIDGLFLGAGAPGAVLRQAKRQAALLIALCDLGGAWDVTQVTGALSAFADAAVRFALDYLLADAVQAGRIETADGLFVLGLGKLGAQELNYSSDIDLIIFFDPQRFKARGNKSDTERAITIVQGLVRLLHDVTAEGYVFRVDLRLRPDPGAMPVALSILAAESYYEARGQVWERAAFIKARTIAGDIAAGDQFLARLAPFVFRRHLDFEAISEIHDIKRRLNAHAGHSEIALAGYDIKIGRGGIREIEFFAQGQQLIAGGREAKLRSRRTLASLSALADLGMIKGTVLRDLSNAYRYLRQVEHRLQMIADEQTQRLPKSQDGLERLAHFMGASDLAEFAQTLDGHLHRVAAHYDALFADTPGHGHGLSFDGPEIPAATLDRLAAMGFEDVQSAAHIVRAWVSGRPPSLHNARARERLSAILDDLLMAIGASDDPRGGLVRLDTFINHLPAGLQIFHLLQANPKLIKLLVEVLGNAPRLARLLAEQATSFDAVIAPGFFEELPSLKSLHRQFNRLHADQVVEGTHRLVREGRLRVGLQLLTGRIGAQAAGPFLADLACAAMSRLVADVTEQFAARHGAIAGGEFAIIGFGRLGGRELTVTSDLDLVFVYAHEPKISSSDGPEPLDPVTWYLRLSQRIIAALGAQTPDGHFFDIDMRLRPSGNKGPIAVSIERLENYYTDEAWTYEFMAATRARVVLASDSFGARIRTCLDQIILRERPVDTLLADIRAMRQRVELSRPAAHVWQLKETAGGLMDIEFAAQALVLAHAARHPQLLVTDTPSILQIAHEQGLLDTQDTDCLRDALILQLDLQQLLRVALDGDIDPAQVPDGLAHALARMGQVGDFAALTDLLQQKQAQAALISRRILGG